MSTSTSNAPEPVQQSLAVLHSGYEQIASFLEAMFGDFERLRAELDEARSQLAAQRSAGDQADAIPSEVEQSLRSRMAELEQERLALEQELEQVRARAVEMAQTIADQKRQMADDNAQWAAELRQLRRTLEKQAAWITQHGKQGPGREKRRRSPRAPEGGGATSNQPELPRDETGPSAAQADDRDAATEPGDVVLGSVLSQFELLQKDVARRRSQSGEQPDAGNPPDPT